MTITETDYASTWKVYSLSGKYDERILARILSLMRKYQIGNKLQEDIAEITYNTDCATTRMKCFQ